MNAARIAATQLIDMGIVPLPLHGGTKTPIGNGWQYSTMPSTAQLATLFPDDEPRNIGALMGTSSGNVYSPDFDVYPAYARWRSEYKPPESRTVFSSRSTRPIYRTEPEALANGTMRSDGVLVGELLADGHHVVMPPSRLKDGFEYTDNGFAIAYMPPDHPAFLALLKLTEKHYSEQITTQIAQGKRKLARFAKAALEGRITIGKRFDSRSELDAALIQSLARSGFDAAEIYDMLDGANLRSHWHERKEKSRRDDIARIIAKFANTNSQISQEALRRADALSHLRQRRQWAGFIDTGKTKIDKDTGEIKPVRVMATTVEAVLLAHETKVRDCLTYTYHLDTRAGDGRFTNMSRPTFERANKIAIDKGFITVAKKAKGTCATLYQLPDVATLEALANRTSDPRKGSVFGHFNTAGAVAAQDGVEVAKYASLSESGVFDYAGLGRTAFLVYRAALAVSVTAKALAALTGLHIKTVRAALKKLARYGLVEKCPGRRWQSDAAVNWQAVGDYLNTTTRVKEKQQQTRARREARANSYKHHSPQRAAHSAKALADPSLADAPNRAVVKATKNVNRYGAKWETLEPARQRADLIDLEKQQHTVTHE